MNGLKWVALFEGAKAALMLLVGLGCASLIHRDVRALALHGLEILHCNPASRFPQLFLQASQQLTDSGLEWLALVAMADAAVRFAEAYGLWFQRRWAEWLAIASGGLYLPFEIYELVEGVSVLKIAALALNLAIVAYLARSLWRRHPTRIEPASN